MASYHIETDATADTVEADSADSAAAEFARGEGVRGVATARDLEAYYARVGGWMTMTDEATGETVAEVE